VASALDQLRLGARGGARIEKSGLIDHRLERLAFEARELEVRSCNGGI
jgi:hypothetical protein